MKIKEKYFYINTDPYADFPPYDEKNIRKISYGNINALAYIASDLEAYPAVTEIEGKKEALKGYFLQTENEKLKEIYDLLMSNINGQRILNAEIILTCFEKTFRESGIRNLENIEKYNQWVEERKKVIDYNKSMYNDKYIINKNK